MFDTDFRPSLSHSGGTRRSAHPFGASADRSRLARTGESPAGGLQAERAAQTPGKEERSTDGGGGCKYETWWAALCQSVLGTQARANNVLIHVPKHALMCASSCTHAHTESCTKPPISPCQHLPSVPSPFWVPVLLKGKSPSMGKGGSAGKGRRLFFPCSLSPFV